jgi:hypothetical protein
MRQLVLIGWGISQLDTSFSFAEILGIVLAVSLESIKASSAAIREDLFGGRARRRDSRIGRTEPVMP